MKTKITVNYKIETKEEAIAKLEKLIKVVKDCDTLSKVDIKFVVIEK